MDPIFFTLAVSRLLRSTDVRFSHMQNMPDKSSIEFDLKQLKSSVLRLLHCRNIFAIDDALLMSKFSLRLFRLVHPENM